MKVKSIIKKQILILTIILVSSFSLISCSNETEDFTKNETSSELNSPNFLSKGGPAYSSLNWTCQSDIISMNAGCYTFQIRFYMTTSEGNTYLIHSAIMSTGDCPQRPNTNSDPCDGDYKGDFIVKDDKVNGCIRDFFDSDINMYNMYTIVRNEIIRN